MNPSGFMGEPTSPRKLLKLLARKFLDSYDL